VRTLTLDHRSPEANGVRLHCAVQEGDGALAILPHGFPECWYLWRVRSQYWHAASASSRHGVPNDRIGLSRRSWSWLRAAEPRETIGRKLKP